MCGEPSIQQIFWGLQPAACQSQVQAHSTCVAVSFSSEPRKQRFKTSRSKILSLCRVIHARDNVCSCSGLRTINMSAQVFDVCSSAHMCCSSVLLLELNSEARSLGVMSKCSEGKGVPFHAGHCRTGMHKEHCWQPLWQQASAM